MKLAILFVTTLLLLLAACEETKSNPCTAPCPDIEYMDECPPGTTTRWELDDCGCEINRYCDETDELIVEECADECPEQEQQAADWCDDGTIVEEKVGECGCTQLRCMQDEYITNN